MMAVKMFPKSRISRSSNGGSNFYSSFFIITCVVIILFPCLNAFRVFVLVPQSVERGHDAILACYTPDLEDHELYRITWLKDGERLYRFKINHPRDRETFHVPGVQIDPLASNLTHLYLKQADISAEGIYACEVETRGPSFRSARNASLLRMFSVPGDFKTVVKISTDDPNGRGDLECTSAPTHPEVKLTWYINGEPAAWNRVTNYPVETTRENLKISKSRLSYVPDDSETSYSCEGLIQFNKFLLKATSQLKVPGSHTGAFPPETFTHETLDDFNQREREFESGNAVISEPFKEDKNQRKRLRSAGNPSLSQVGLASLLLNLVFYCILH